MTLRRAALVALLAGVVSCHRAWPVLDDTAGPRQVFAYYALNTGTTGYAADVTTARAMGIDGFALVVTRWDAAAQARVQAMYDAANAVAPGAFHLFMQPDLGSVPFPDAVLSIAEQVAPYPAQLRLGDRMVFSSIAADVDTDWEGLRARLHAEQIDLVLLPSVFPTTLSGQVIEIPGVSDAAALHARISDVTDGFFFLGQAGAPSQLSAANEAFASDYDGTGQRFIASVAPGYWGSNQASSHQRYFESGGGAGVTAQWQALIDANARNAHHAPTWVEITTWNDYSSDTQITPDPSPPLAGIHTHRGISELFRYEIASFKAGAPAPIDHDEIVLAYRTQPFPTGSPDPMAPHAMGTAPPVDALFVTTLLTAPADLDVFDGTASHRLSVAAGVQTHAVPFTPGTPHVELSRNGTPVVSLGPADALPAITAAVAPYTESMYSTFALAP